MIDDHHIIIMKKKKTNKPNNNNQRNVSNDVVSESQIPKIPNQIPHSFHRRPPPPLSILYIPAESVMMFAYNI